MLILSMEFLTKEHQYITALISLFYHEDNPL